MPDEVQEIKNRIDIVDVVQEYTRLKQAGRHWKACCPFHKEKTPSFIISRDKQFFHCFGCGKSGDVFNFIQEIEGLEFREALKLLADKAGVKLVEHHEEVHKDQKNRILEINLFASLWYNKLLTGHPAGAPAREYLERRGVTAHDIQSFQIGFVPDQWDAFTKALLKRGFGVDDIIASGFGIRGERGVYDRFRGRVMFPLWNVQGQVVGFTGRVLVETEKSGGKYVNTPETPVYNKSAVLYGLNKARQDARVKDFLVVVEGQMDVIACHRIGMTNVVAASGTALTVQQVQLIKRYTTNVRVAFDQDAAGIAAAKRGMDVALQSGLNVKVIQIPEGGGKDADECIKKDKSVWERAVDNAFDIMEFYFNVTLNDPRVATDAHLKHTAAVELLKQIAKLPSPVVQDHWVQELATRLRSSVQSLGAELKQIMAQEKNMATSRAVAPGARVAVGAASAPFQPTSKHHKLSQEIMSILLAFGPSTGQNGAKIELLPTLIANTPFDPIYKQLRVYYTKDVQEQAPQASPEGFLQYLKTTESAEVVAEALRLSLLGESLYQELTPNDRNAVLLTLIKAVQTEYVQERRREITFLIQEAHKSGDTAREEHLLQELQNLSAPHSS